MSLQMLKSKIKSLGFKPLGDTADALRKQLVFIEHPKTEEKTAAEADVILAISSEPGQSGGKVDEFGKPVEKKGIKSWIDKLKGKKVETNE